MYLNDVQSITRSIIQFFLYIFAVKGVSPFQPETEKKEIIIRKNTKGKEQKEEDTTCSHTLESIDRLVLLNCIHY